ncbi:MAG TPA: GNAT family N-acetyltransferase [Thermoanaerobaculia bacterium]|nr:GNAT family N-acetyltransferase [Thermoanaerobaculia bacterium]
MRERISFRPETSDDEEFLYRLYASTREPEMRIVPWTAEQKEEFLRMQFRAQTFHYRNHYSGATFAILLLDGDPVGRLYLHQQPGDLRIMDIALVPEHRGEGIGTMLLREIMERAASAGDSVSIHVEQQNPARRLYERLGFRAVAENGVYLLMKWHPAAR